MRSLIAAVVLVTCTAIPLCAADKKTAGKKPAAKKITYDDHVKPIFPREMLLLPQRQQEEWRARSHELHEHDARREFRRSHRTRGGRRQLPVFAGHPRLGTLHAAEVGETGEGLARNDSQMDRRRSARERRQQTGHHEEEIRPCSKVGPDRETNRPATDAGPPQPPTGLAHTANHRGHRAGDQPVGAADCRRRAEAGLPV